MANPVVHFEVTGKDGKKLQDFYAKTFGWKVNADNPMNYGIVDAPDTGGGMGGGISAGAGGTKQVTFYIALDNPQSYLDKIESKGGKTVMPLTEIQGIVKFAQYADPEGNVVGIIDANYGPQS
jgi:predicted enzyme related to lactoylglutathione lyase